MKDRILFAIIIFFVLGSSVTSGNDSINQTAKSIFHGFGMFTLGLIGIYSFYNVFEKRRAERKLDHKK
ncbi:hypothetical protein ACRC6Q_08985 [Planococcus sp. SE5232]|uniref:hypothetical protein n=1 Tax=unclassified Planococcus (in: firmicutes) TaxID=2662419 RepID=UPI001CC11C72|nr:hypothetical protein [Planococcus sp. 4-30]